MLKPAFFRNPELCRCSFQARIFFEGLWCLADREGRVAERHGDLKLDVFPYDHADIPALLEELSDARDEEGVGLVVRYCVENRRYLWIPGFARQAKPHVREPASNLPAPPKVLESTNPAPTLHPPCTNPAREGLPESESESETETETPPESGREKEKGKKKERPPRPASALGGAPSEALSHEDRRLAAIMEDLRREKCDGDADPGLRSVGSQAPSAEDRRAQALAAVRNRRTG